MKEPTLAEALEARGIRYEKSKIEGKNDLYDGKGRHLGCFDAQEAWDWLQENAELNWIEGEAK